MKTLQFCIVGACVVIVTSATPSGLAHAQSGTFFNQRDDTYPLLGLKRAKEAYETARLEYERQTELFDKRLVSRQEYDRASSNLADAEVNYQQSLLAVLFEQQYVVISSAVKYQGRCKSQARARGAGEFDRGNGRVSEADRHRGRTLPFPPTRRHQQPVRLPGKR